MPPRLPPEAAFAASSATIAFDFVSDPGDLGDGPDYDVTATGLVDDGSGCDSVVAVMVDATGTVTDVDSFCLDLVTGLGGSDGDYGSFGTGYLPLAGPATYAVFDLTADDIAALTLAGLGENDDPGYVTYVLANSTFLTEGYVDVDLLTSGVPHSFSRSYQCYQGKDLKNPKFTPVSDVPVVDQLGTFSVDVKKPYLVCAPAGIGTHLCCYKTKGPKLPAPANVATDDGFGTLELQLRSPKLLCTAYVATPLP